MLFSIIFHILHNKKGLARSHKQGRTSNNNKSFTIIYTKTGLPKCSTENTKIKIEILT